MQLPNITTGNTAFKGNIDHDKRDIEQGKQQNSPSAGVGGGIEFSDKPGTDVSTLFSNNAGASGGGAKQGGLTGIASQLSDATALIPGLSNVLKGIGNSDGSLGGMLGGAVGGAAQTAKQSVEGIAKGVLNGEVSMAAMGTNALLNNYEKNEQTPALVKTLAGLP